MGNKKSFDRLYSINVARLKDGKNVDSFVIDDVFLSHFEQSLISAANVKAEVEIIKSHAHLDTTFRMSGSIEIPCDRCGEAYAQPIEDTHRIFYAFDKDFLNDEEQEVIYINPANPQVSLVQELYDFLLVSVPLRRVPSKKVHECSSAIMALLVSDEAEVVEDTEEEESVDPRWAALKKLKDNMDE